MKNLGETPGENQPEKSVDIQNSNQASGAGRSRTSRWMGVSRFQPVSRGEPDFESKVLAICRDVVANTYSRRHPSFKVLMDTYELSMINYIRRYLTKILNCFGNSKDLLEMKVQDVFNAGCWNIWDSLVNRKIVLDETNGFTWFVKSVYYQACMDAMREELTRKQAPRADMVKSLLRLAEESTDPIEKAELQLEIEHEQKRERQYVYEIDTIANLECPDPDPEALYQSKEIAGIILELASTEVKTPHTQVYAKYIIDDINQETISQIQGVLPSAISKRMQAFKNEIRGLLDEMGIDPKAFPL